MILQKFQFKINRIVYFIFFLYINCYSQKPNKFYTSFSSTNNGEYRIRFLSNNLVEFHNIPTHMSRNISFTNSYYIENKNIIIEIQNLNFEQKKNLKTYGLEFLIGKKIILIKTKKELIDINNKTVYVEQKKLNKNFVRRKSILIIDGKKYFNDRGIINSYGLYEKLPKKNEKIYDFIINNVTNPTHTYQYIYGLEAYKKYGILGINGVSVFNKIK